MKCRNILNVLTCSGDRFTFDIPEVRSDTILQLGICAGTEMVRERGNSSTAVMHWREEGRMAHRVAISQTTYLQ